MKRTASREEEQQEEEHRSKRPSPIHLSSLALSALRSGMSREQIAYEQWVDRQPIGEVKGWEEMGGEERGEWMKVMGIEGEKEEVGKGEEKEEGKGEREEEREEKEGDAVGDLGEGRWMAVRCGGGEKDESLILDALPENSSPTLSPAEPSSPTAEPVPTAPSPVAESPPIPPFQRPYRAGYRVWTPTTTEDSVTKNKPQCPPCARLKRTWTRCRGGPPCVECQHRGLSAEQCQSYDLLNRSRKNRLKKRKEECKKEEVEIRDEDGEGGQKEEQAGEDAADEGKETPSETTDSKSLEVAEDLELEEAQ
ncbi:hypothetical protein V8E51_018036 [Hyaloscypha variabilis]